MVQAHSAHALVAGCPAKYTLLQSTPYLDNNFFLYGHSAVVTDAYKSSGSTKASRALSPLLPGPWYAWNQTYVPYNLEGLDGKSIIKEVLHAMPPEHAHQGETDRQYRRRVWKLLVDMHGDQKWYSLRIGSWLLSLIFKWLFNGELFVNLEVCSKLRELAPKSTFVYVPTHKSHLDYHMLSYVLFAEGLACPHIAAGDNLNLPIIGRIMRTCGAFFIRRTIKNCSDEALYKACLDRYLHTLMAHGSPTEFFIEGGRARDGRIAPPKLGLLTSTVQAALTPKGSREGNLYIVPVAISYDFPLEEAGLLRELLGDKKRKETIWQFISAFSKLVAKLGMGYPEVTFEKLIDLARAEDAAQNPQAFATSDTSLNPGASGSGSSSTDSVVALAEALPPGSDSRRAAVAALGNEIHTRLLRSNCVPSSAVLAAALLPAAVVGKCGEFGDPDNSTTVGPEPTNTRKQPQPAKLPSELLIQRYRWVQRQLTSHGVPVMPLPVAPLEIPCCAQSPAFLHDISVACAPHVAVTKHKRPPPTPPASSSGAATDSSHGGSTPQQQPQKQAHGSTSSPGPPHRQSARGAAQPRHKPTAPFSVNLQQGAEPVLWQHTRLNTVLPATAPVGLVAAALCAASSGVMPCGAESNGTGAGAVDSACIVSNVLWLRSFLGPDLNAALGMETLTSPQSVQSELSALVHAGAIFRASPQSSQASSPIIDSSLDLPAALEVASMPSPSNAPLDVFADAANIVATGANGSFGDLQGHPLTHAAHANTHTANGSSVANGMAENGAASTPLCFCVSESSRKMLAFHAATLAPLIATYAAVLKYACAKLSAGEVMTRAEFSETALKWLRDSAADSTSAISAVPSQLLVQNAVEALVEEGCLAAVEEEPTLAAQEAEASTTLADRVGNASAQSVLAGLSPVATRPTTPPPTSVGASNSDSLPVAYPISGGLVGPARGRKAVAEAKGGIAAAKDGRIALHAPATARRVLSTLQHALGAMEPLQVTLPDI